MWTGAQGRERGAGSISSRWPERPLPSSASQLQLRAPRVPPCALSSTSVLRGAGVPLLPALKSPFRFPFLRREPGHLPPVGPGASFLPSVLRNPGYVHQREDAQGPSLESLSQEGTLPSGATFSPWLGRPEFRDAPFFPTREHLQGPGGVVPEAIPQPEADAMRVDKTWAERAEPCGDLARCGEQAPPGSRLPTAHRSAQGTPPGQVDQTLQA